MAGKKDEGTVIRPKLEKYTSGRSASGKVTKNCGDFVAELTNGFTLNELASVAAKVRDDVDSATALINRYKGLKNDGMRVMNIRNLLRKVAKTKDGQQALEAAAKPYLSKAVQRVEAKPAPKPKAKKKASKKKATRKKAA